jgi:hypothetical protein
MGGECAVCRELSEAPIVHRLAFDPDWLGDAWVARVFGGAAAAAVDCARHRCTVDRHCKARSGLRRTGGDGLGGGPSEPAAFDAGAAGFRGDTHGVGLEFPGFDQCTVVAPAGGPHFGRRWQLFELVSLHGGQPGDSIREPGGWGFVGASGGETGLDHS